MNAADAVAMACDPTLILKAAGLDADPWQKALLYSREKQIMLNCCRQSGKSTTTAAIALHQALFTPKSLILLLSPGQRQSGEIFRKVIEFNRAIGQPIAAKHRTERMLELVNGSRIISLPGVEHTVRSFSGVSLIVLDEAAHVPDELYYSVRPMLAVSRGRLIALSTPYGQRGWFWREFTGTGNFQRFSVTWQDCPRISAEFIDEETRAMGQPWVDQEYLCLFTTLQGLVYPEFKQCLIDIAPLELPKMGRLVGGIDWGWRNPFAAVWGFHDKGGSAHTPPDVLYIVGERYMRQTLMTEHVAALKKVRGTEWYADPSGPDQINECRAAGITVRKGFNEIQLGIAAVTARIRTGRLKVLRTACHNLIAEAELYRYPTESERVLLGEKPVDADNHALGALRYLISRLDYSFIAKLRRRPEMVNGEIPDDKIAQERLNEYKPRVNKPWIRLDNPALWPQR